MKMSVFIKRFACERSVSRVLLLSFAFWLPLLASTPRIAVGRQDYGRVAALCDSGTALLERGDLDGAKALFEQALELDDKYYRAVLGMGRVWLDTRDGQRRALDRLKEAVALMPTSPDAHYYKAFAHLRAARIDPLRENTNEAMREFGLAVELNPSHSDALYQIGMLEIDIFEDPEAAAAAFEQQIVVNPAHHEARVELLKVKMALGRWDSSAEIAEELIGRDPEAKDAYPYLAGAFWKAERYEEAMQVFERYFPLLDQEELNLYLDMGLLLTPGEQDEYFSLSDSGRETFRNHYWSTRDPDPKTFVNERLLEHFVRVAWARIEFGEQEWPWDARGSFYVRYGEPDHRMGPGRPFAEELIDDDPLFLRNKRDFYESMGLSPVQDEISASQGIGGRRPGFRDASMATEQEGEATGGAERTPERWVYMDKGVDVIFRDPIGRGRYLLTDDIHRQVVQQMEVRLPIMSPVEERIELIDPMDSVVTFKGEEGKTAVEYAFALLPDEFGAFRSSTGTYATLDIDVKLFTEEWEEVASAGEKARRVQTVPQVRIRGIPLFVDATRLEVEPGVYRLTTMLLDPETGKRATAEELVELPDYSGSELMVSNILPAANIREVALGVEGRFIRGELEVLPLPGRALQADQNLFIYYEVYNLAKDQFGATSYSIEYSVAEAPEGRSLTTRLFQGIRNLVSRRRRAVISHTASGSNIHSDMNSYLEIDLSDLRPQTYELYLTITDNLTRKTADSSLVFRTLPP